MITPMVAKLVRDPFNRVGWFFELKWDGFRAIAEKDKLGVRLYSRNQNDFKKRFPTIAQAVSALDNVILDGEIVALDEQGQPRFEWLVNRGPQKGTIVYYVFDLLRLGDKDLRSEPLYRRKSLLQKLLRKNDTLRYVDHITEGLAMYAGAMALGLEGIVAKDSKSHYIEGPAENRFWLKIKNKDFQRKEPVEFRQNRPRRSAKGISQLTSPQSSTPMPAGNSPLASGRCRLHRRGCTMSSPRSEKLRHQVSPTGGEPSNLVHIC